MAYDIAPEATPPPAQLAAWLRARVVRLRRESLRRLFAARLEIVADLPAEPSAPAVATEAPRTGDHGLRVDVAIRLLSATDPAAGQRVALVHVRPGPPELADSDFAWWSAARCTRGLVELEVVRAVVVTRWGWIDVASGQRKTWKRLRS